MKDALVNKNVGLEDLEEIRGKVSERAEQLGIAPERIYDLLLAVTELVTNSIEHGYQADFGFIEIEMVLEGEYLVVYIRDRAAEFNPLELPDPDLSLPLEQRADGGLGIFLTRKVVDQLTYKRLPDGLNEIRIEIKISQVTRIDKEAVDEPRD